MAYTRRKVWFDKKGTKHVAYLTMGDAATTPTPAASGDGSPMWANVVSAAALVGYLTSKPKSSLRKASYAAGAVGLAGTIVYPLFKKGS